MFGNVRKIMGRNKKKISMPALKPEYYLTLC